MAVNRRRPVAVVLGPDSALLDLRLTEPGFGWHDRFDILKVSGAVGVTNDDDPVDGRAQSLAN